MGFVERNITGLYVVFVVIFLFTAGYLLVTAGKREGSEEIKNEINRQNAVHYSVLYF